MSQPHSDVDARRQTIAIGDRHVGAGEPVYVIGEAGVNHDGKANDAHRMIDVAAQAGVDAVKFQAFVPELLCAENAPSAAYAREHASDQRSLLAPLALPFDVLAELKAHAHERGLTFLCTAFDAESLERLIELHLAAYKFASTDLNNVPLIARAAQTGKPLLLSTGASTPAEIDEAVRAHAPASILLFHCVSSYPTPVENLALSTIGALSRRHHRVVGFSDHSMGIDTGGWAVAAGAVALEKHFTLDRSRPGPDHGLSLNPEELSDYVRLARDAHRALGRPRTDVFEGERDVRRAARKSCFARRFLPSDHVVALEDLVFQRPGTGIGPDRAGDLVGRRTTRSIPQGTMLNWDMLDR